MTALSLCLPSTNTTSSDFVVVEKHQMGPNGGSAAITDRVDELPFTGVPADDLTSAWISDAVLRVTSLLRSKAPVKRVPPPVSLSQHSRHTAVTVKGGVNGGLAIHAILGASLWAALFVYACVCFFL